jgi:thymidylate synthase (FAD)
MQVELLALTPDPETVIEQAGRTCHMSHDRMRPDSSAKFIRMLVSKRHLSVLEHAYATFRITGISRAATHQLVRHRLCSFAQRSQRYVREEASDVVIPDSIRDSAEALAIYTGSIEASKQAYEDLLRCGIPKEDARFVMPNATTSDIVLSANFRQLRHVIMTRGAREAQWEVRALAIEILHIMTEHAPNVFFDLIVSPRGHVEQTH